MAHRRYSTPGQMQTPAVPTDTIDQPTAPFNDDQETHVQEGSTASIASAAGQDTAPTMPTHDQPIGPLNGTQAPPTNPTDLAQRSLTATLAAARPGQQSPPSSTTDTELDEWMIEDLGQDSGNDAAAPSEYLDHTGMAWGFREPYDDTESARAQAARFFAEVADNPRLSSRAQTRSQTSLLNGVRLSNRLSSLRQLQVEEVLRPLRRPSLVRSRGYPSVAPAQAHQAHLAAEQTRTDPNTEHVAEEASATPDGQFSAAQHAVRTRVDRRRQEAEDCTLPSAPNNITGFLSPGNVEARRGGNELRHHTNRPPFVDSTGHLQWAWDTDEVQVPQPDNVRRRTTVPGRDYPEQQPAVARNEGLLARDPVDAMRHARYPALDAPRAMLQARLAERQALANAEHETNPIEASGPGDDEVAAAQRALATTIDGRQGEPPSSRNPVLREQLKKAQITAQRHNNLRKERVQDQLAKNECPICQEELTNPVSTTCGHVFCRACVEPWIRDHGDCPSCREAHTVENLVSMNRRGMGA